MPNAAAEIEADISYHPKQGYCLVANTSDLASFSSSCTYYFNNRHIFWVNKEKYIL
jgi:hypothetical protein